MSEGIDVVQRPSGRVEPLVRQQPQGKSVDDDYNSKFNDKLSKLLGRPIRLGYVNSEKTKVTELGNGTHLSESYLTLTMFTFNEHPLLDN